MPVDIGELNPIRYRGYYYDVETGWYFLQTRYYNPEWRRFLNADSFFIAGCKLTENNMYAYCRNNPVMFVDPDGMSAVHYLLAVFALGAIAQATFEHYDLIDALSLIVVAITAVSYSDNGVEFLHFVDALGQAVESMIDSDNKYAHFYSHRLFTSKNVSLAMGRFMAPHFNMTVQEIAEEIYAHAMIYHEFPTVGALLRTFAPDYYETIKEQARITDMYTNGDTNAGIYKFIWDRTNGLR